MQDPVCGMDVAPDSAAVTSLHEGQIYYFCARACKVSFDKDPERFARSEAELPQHARALYDALETLNNAFYGPTAYPASGSELTGAEWDALRLLGRRGECMMREVAAECAVALSTMTGIIDRLIKKGLAQRRHSDTDRRVILVRCTGRGRLAYDERLDADMRLVLTMLDALNPQEQKQLVTLVQKGIRSLPDTPAMPSPIGLRGESHDGIPTS